MRPIAASIRWLAALLACAPILMFSTASATTVNVLPGGQLTLGNSYLQGSSLTPSSAVTVNDLSGNMAGSYTYANGWGGAQTAISASGVPTNTYGFYDDFVFTITGSSLDSITSTINLSSGSVNTKIVNLDAQLFNVSGNNTLPAFTPSGMVTDPAGVTNFTLGPGVSGTTVVLAPPGALAAGTYVLQIRGWETGTAGGSYSGVLNVAPVPLPASVWMLIAALGLMALQIRRRRAQWAPIFPA
jgi:hypothetical protein